MPGEHKEKRPRAPRGFEPAATLSGVGRRRLGVLVAVAVLAAAIAAVALSGRGDKSPAPPRPAQARPAHQGDTADLMRRLERKKLVQGSR